MATKKETAQAVEKKSRSKDKSNLISAVFGAAAIKEVDSLLDKARDAMPFLIGLSSEERSETLRVGDTLIDGALQIIELVREYGDYIPKAIADPDEMERDAALDVALAKVELKLTELLRLVQDARLLARSDLSRAALAAYTASRMIPDDLGAASKREKLKSFFASRVRK